MLKFLGHTTTGKLHTAYGVGEVNGKGEVSGIKAEDAKELAKLLPNLFEYKGSASTVKKDTAEKKATTKRTPAVKKEED